MFRPNPKNIIISFIIVQFYYWSVLFTTEMVNNITTMGYNGQIALISSIFYRADIVTAKYVQVSYENV